MSDNAVSPQAAAFPPGWYPDHADARLIRWWDGAAWTAYTAPLAATAGSVRPPLPPDRPIYSPLIWVIVGLPLISSIGILFWNPDFAALVPTDGGRPDPFAIYTPGYFALIGLSWLLYALNVVLAARDRAWLLRQGVERPFHWGWAFFGPLVYVIGRTVIVHGVARPRGLAPIWALIGVTLTTWIIVGIWYVTFFSRLMDSVRPSVGA